MAKHHKNRAQRWHKKDPTTEKWNCAEQIVKYCVENGIKIEIEYVEEMAVNLIGIE